MNRNEEHEALLIAQGEGHLIPGQTSAATTPEARPAPRKMGFGQKTVVAILLTVVLVPPLGGFYSYFSGVPLHLLASSKEAEKARGHFRPSERLAGPGASPYSEGPGGSLRRPGNPQGRTGRGRGRVAAEDDAAARASRFHRASIPPALPASALASLRPEW